MYRFAHLSREDNAKRLYPPLERVSLVIWALISGLMYSFATITFPKTMHFKTRFAL